MSNSAVVEASSLSGFIIACFRGEEPDQHNVGLLPVLARDAQEAITLSMSSDPLLRIVGCMSEVQLKQQLAMIEDLRKSIKN